MSNRPHLNPRRLTFERALRGGYTAADPDPASPIARRTREDLAAAVWLVEYIERTGGVAGDVTYRL